MQERSRTVAPSHSDISAALHTWHAALAAARASEDADLYALAIVLVLEVLSPYTTLHSLIIAYCSPDVALRSRVLELCDQGDIHLDPWVALGAACALQFRQLMKDAIG
jgi:hypothetical protein